MIIQYPINDNQFEEKKITGVEGNKEEGYSITTDDGWTLGLSKNSPIEPKIGMVARFYGKGIGYTVRGVFLNGEEVFYRTEKEDKEKSQIDIYGKDAKDWLERWDAGKTVWSIEMGGMGPGYEQCIQITCAEILRILIDYKYNVEGTDEERKHDMEVMKGIMHDNKKIEKLGLSGAQAGAGWNLAIMLYKSGPCFVMNDDRVKDRHIMVSNNFPSL